MKTKKIKVRQGFTIVELVIVIGVIGVLTAVLVPTFINLNKKAEMASQQSFLKNVNTQLAMRQAEGGKLDTMSDAIQVADEMGFDVEKISPIDGNDIVYDMKANRFAMMKGEEVTFSDGGLKGSGVEIWKIADSAAKATELNNAGYSIYAKETWNIGNLADIKVGFDAGRNMTANSVSYVNPSAKQNVVIRTNGGTLNINDGSEGSIYHYGKAGLIDIVQCHTASYHENGKVELLSIKKGHVALEKESKVENMHFVQKDSSSFDQLVLSVSEGAQVPELSKDPVPGTESGVLVAEVKQQTSSEYIWIKSTGDVVVSSSGTQIAEKTESESSALAKKVAVETQENTKTTEEVKEATVSIRIENAQQLEQFLASNNQKAELIKNVVFNNKLTISKNKTINLGGYKLSYVPNEKDTYPFAVINNAAFLLENGSFEIPESNEKTAIGFVRFSAHDADISVQPTDANEKFTAKNVEMVGYKMINPIQNGTILKRGGAFNAAGKGNQTVELIDSKIVFNEKTNTEANRNGVVTMGYGTNVVVKNSSIDYQAGATVRHNVFFYNDGCGDCGHNSIDIENSVITSNVVFGEFGGDSNVSVKESTIKILSDTGYYPSALSVASDDVLVINGGNYEGSARALEVYSSGGSVVINGGTFKGGDASSVPQTSGSGAADKCCIESNFDSSYASTYEGASVTINDGVFYGSLHTVDYGTIVINGGTFHSVSFVKSTNGSIVITGGSFDADPSAYVDADAYTVTENAGIYTVSAK